MIGIYVLWKMLEFNDIFQRCRSAKKNQLEMRLLSYPLAKPHNLAAQKDLSHCDGHFEYPQHMFWFRYKKIDL